MAKAFLLLKLIVTSAVPFLELLVWPGLEPETNSDPGVLLLSQINWSIKQDLIDQ